MSKQYQKQKLKWYAQGRKEGLLIGEKDGYSKAQKEERKKYALALSKALKFRDDEELGFILRLPREWLEYSFMKERIAQLEKEKKNGS
jgi:hypothetical protein